jgi:hypothetical protein
MPVTYPSKVINLHRTDNVTFAKDDKGRSVGAHVVMYEQEFTAAPADVRSGCVVPPGYYFFFTPIATRGGKRYGASQGDRRFSTEAERSKAIARYMADAQKRAVKKWG